MHLLWSCFLCGLSAICVDLVPLSALLPYWFVPVADTLVGHGALAGVAWSLGAGSWASARGSGSWGHQTGSTFVSGCTNAPLVRCALEAVLAPKGPFTVGATAWAVVIAVAVDADHFIAARSLRLRDALSLTSRPFGHSLGALFGAVLLTALAARFNIVPSWSPALVALSYISHLIHDAVKRGFLLAPLPGGSTPLLPYVLYVLALAAAPALLLAALTASSPTLLRPSQPFAA